MAKKEHSIPEHLVAHRYISDRLRAQVRRGELAPGEKLPSTKEMSKQWNTSDFTIHTALKNLVKEGLLERRHGLGTFVCERRVALEQVGIYQSNPNIWIREDMSFYRLLHNLLEQKLKQRSILPRIFFDHREPGQQNTVTPELASAIAHKEIQGLIIPATNPVNLPPLRSLALPISALTTAKGMQNKIVVFDAQTYFREFLTRLSAKDCESVALISATQDNFKTTGKKTRLEIEEIFLLEVEAHGMSTRNSWIVRPSTEVDSLMRYGYDEFHQLWRQGGNPDAIIVYPDTLVTGVIIAALELGVHQRSVTFCFHQNEHNPSICPFPAILAITDEEQIADELINLVQVQFNGGKPTPVYIKDTFIDRTYPR